jgi:hypothetical protein
LKAYAIERSYLSHNTCTQLVVNPNRLLHHLINSKSHLANLAQSARIRVFVIVLGFHLNNLIHLNEKENREAKKSNENDDEAGDGFAVCRSSDLSIREEEVYKSTFNLKGYVLLLNRLSVSNHFIFYSIFLRIFSNIQLPIFSHARAIL